MLLQAVYMRQSRNVLGQLYRWYTYQQLPVVDFRAFSLSLVLNVTRVGLGRVHLASFNGRLSCPNVGVLPGHVCVLFM